VSFLRCRYLEANYSCYEAALPKYEEVGMTGAAERWQWSLDERCPLLVRQTYLRQ